MWPWNCKRCGGHLPAREAELATAIPVVIDPAMEGVRLAERLEAVLRGGAEAIGAASAGLYLLDDRTENLKLRRTGSCRHGACASRLGLCGRRMPTSKHWQAMPLPSRTARPRERGTCRTNVVPPCACRSPRRRHCWGLCGPSITNRKRSATNRRTCGRSSRGGWRPNWNGKPSSAIESRDERRRPGTGGPRPPCRCSVHDAFHAEGWSATSRIPASEMDRTVLIHLDRSPQRCCVARPSPRTTTTDWPVPSWPRRPSPALAAPRSPWLSTQRYRQVHKELFRESTGDSFLSAASFELDRATGRRARRIGRSRRRVHHSTARLGTVDSRFGSPGRRHGHQGRAPLAESTGTGRLVAPATGRRPAFAPRTRRTGNGRPSPGGGPVTATRSVGRVGRGRPVAAGAAPPVGMAQAAEHVLLVRRK